MGLGEERGQIEGVADARLQEKRDEEEGDSIC